MDRNSSREILRSRIGAVRRKLLFNSIVSAGIRAGNYVLPVAAIAIAVDSYFRSGDDVLWIALATLGILGFLVVLAAYRRWRSPLASAHALDERAALKDRIATAWEFLNAPTELDEPRRLQVLDALRHADEADLKSLFHFTAPRSVYLAPIFLALFAASFFMPARVAMVSEAEAVARVQKEQQLRELQALRDELEEYGVEEQELRDVLRKLEDIERRFHEGQATERDVLIELARMDEQLRAQMAELGVEQLAAELGTITPHMMAGEASRGAAQALKREDFDKAAQEMEKLAEKMQQDKLTAKEKEEMARNFGVAASKLGKQSQNSFSGDFSGASEGLKNNDASKFSQSSKGISDKFSRLQKRQNLNKMRSSLSLCKACLGQPKFCAECNGQGCSACQGLGMKLGQRPGGLKAGVGSADPFGDPNRLADSFKTMVHVIGMQGEGPVDSEVETTEGQLGQSGLDAKEVYEEYSAIAEQAIEREEVPLSRRYHVKRYFQSIRPQE